MHEVQALCGRFSCAANPHNIIHRRPGGAVGSSEEEGRERLFLESRVVCRMPIPVDFRPDPVAASVGTAMYQGGIMQPLPLPRRGSAAIGLNVERSDRRPPEEPILSVPRAARATE